MNARIVLILICGLIAAFCVWLILYATPQGLGLSDDSIAYIAGARSMLNGQGYREAWLASNGPVTHFPPGFPSLLAAAGLVGLDPLRGARLLNSLLFGANAFLLGMIGWRMTRSQAAAIMLALLFALNASLLRVHAVAMSEPLYIFFSLAAFLVFSQFFQDHKNGWLVATGCLVAFAYLTRYAGLALLATFILALIVLEDTWRRRWIGSALILAGCVPFLIGWSIRNRLVADNATNRRLVFHALTSENIETGIYNFSEFLMPFETWRRTLMQIPGFFVAVLVILGLSLFGWLAWQAWRRFSAPSAGHPEVLSFTHGLYILGYLASIFSSMLLFDASTKFKLRILSPVYVALLVLLVYLGCQLWERRSMLWRGLTSVLAVLVFALSFNGMYAAVSELHRGGQGYASFQWYDSEAMGFLDGLPEDTRIYTNQPGPVYLYTDRPSYVLPDLVDPVTALPREGYQEGVDTLQKDVLSGNAVLALFKFGSEAEDVQSVYLQLADGLHLAFESHGDKIYTAFP